MKKRILPALLALCMVMSLLPVAFADGNPTPAKHEDCACDSCLCPADNHVKAECSVCKECSKCNPCPVCGDTKVAGHAKGGEKHTNSTCPGTNANIAKGTCGATNHKAGCADFVKCTFSDCTQEQNHANAHDNRTCPGTADTQNACGATSHVKACTQKCTCTNEKVHGKDAEGHAKGCTGSVKDEGKCASCLTNANCNPCEKAGRNGCTLYKGHPGAHTGTACTLDSQCTASIHETTGAGGQGNDPCPQKCETTGCTLTKGHTVKHNSPATTCTNDAQCPAASKTHTAPVYDAKTEGEKTSEGCPQFKACTVCIELEGSNTTWSPKAAGHDGNHNNTKCLGYNDDGKCGAAADDHIAGCSKAKCKCQTSDAELKHEGCTGKAGCPACAVLDNCDCPVCRANPALGAVEEPEEDPAEPTTPDVPEKAEDFTDMEDWMAADVQTMLDKGWMTGMPEGKFEGRKDTTGEQVITVIARMLGADIKSGAEWRDSLNAWIEENPDLVEGIEITNGPMARKDIVLVLWRAAEKPESDFDLGEKFSDVDGLEGDRLTAMKWAAEKEIVRGNGDDTVTPDGNVTRAALAATAARYDALEK